MHRLTHRIRPYIRPSLVLRNRRDGLTLDGISATMLRLGATCAFAAVALAVHAAPLESAKLAGGTSHPPGVAAGDDDLWSPVFHGPGVSGRYGQYAAVRALGVFADELIVGGSFTTAGPIRAGNIARWNGSQWTAMGAGLTSSVSRWDIGSVECVAIYDGQWVAGGNFNRSGDTLLGGIAAWDGQEWQPLGGGFNGTVRGLAVHAGLLVAVGDFDVAAGLPAQHVAAWDGRLWRALATDMVDEVQWSPEVRPEDPPPRVLSVASFHGDLYIGGSFTRINGMPIRDIARWTNGTWLPVGPGTYGDVTSLQVHDDALIVGGSFTRVGEMPAPGLARWDGTAWSQLGDRGVPWDTGYVTELVEFGGKLAVLGSFNIRNRDTSLVLWNGRGWERTTAPALWTAAAQEYQGRLFVGGAFSEGTPVPLNNVAIWAGDGWDPVGPGGGLALEEDYPEFGPLPDEAAWPGPIIIVRGGYEDEPAVQVFAEYQGDVIAAGRFDWAGRERVNNIARWDGTTWKPLGTGIAGGVGAMTVFGGELVVGGVFEEAGGVPVRNVAAWDGTRWRALGDAPAGVRSFTEFQGKLIAVGEFHRVGGQEAHGVAAWDGQRWARLSFGLFREPRFVLVHDGALIVAGTIDWTGHQKVGNVVRWTGDRWESLGSGLSGQQGEVTALLETEGGLLAVLWSGDMYLWDGATWTLRGRIPFGPTAVVEHAGILYAAGLHNEGQVILPDIARWDGITWRPLGSGIGYYGRVLWPSGGSLYVGGGFNRAGPYVSIGVARWDGLGVAPALPGEVPRETRTPLPRRSELTLMGPGADGRVRVHYSLATEAVPVRLAIYDVRGRLVRVLEQSTTGGGARERVWDRLDARGTAVARGAYFVRLEAGGERLTRKLMLWK